MHVLPRVRELHERFADALTVIGVHAGKFTRERQTDRIAAAADRLGVHHAIVNDRHFRIWRAYAVNAWPTIALIDAEGYLIATEAGEFDIESVAGIVSEAIAQAEADRTFVRGPEPYVRVPPPEGGVLRFPTRAIESDGRIFVSDAGHGRVLEAELDDAGSRARVVGEWRGLVEPQGIAIAPSDGSSPRGDVFVADRGGHTIWRLITGTGETERVAGTGRISAYPLPAEGVALATDLRSPWGLLATPKGLLVTMAGSHQLYSVDLEQGALELVAGSGAEDVREGQGARAALAQPTGVCAGAEGAFVADCESSAIRRVDDASYVSTVVGRGLFDFGDKDGTAREALLQHCLDVAWTIDGVLAVADTYNDRLRRVDPATGETTGWTGEAGVAGALREPGGVSAGSPAYPAGQLVVADTGNHRIVRVTRDGSILPIEIEGA